MRDTRKAAVFERAAIAVRRTLATGRSTSMHVQNMKAARMTLRFFIRHLSTGHSPHAVALEEALHDLHSRTEYCEDMMIRDLADVCITLNRLEQGRRRSDRDKLIQAQLLCEYLRDELSRTRGDAPSQ